MQIQNRIFRILGLLALMFPSFAIFGSVEREIISLTGGEIQQDAVPNSSDLTIEDQYLTYVLANPVGSVDPYTNDFIFNSSKAVIRLRYDQSNSSVVLPDQWGVIVNVDASYRTYDNPDVEQIISGIQLGINWDQGIGSVPAVDVEIKEIPDAILVDLEITSVTLTGISNIPDDVHLDLIYTNDKNFKLDASVPSLQFDIDGNAPLGNCGVIETGQNSIISSPYDHIDFYWSPLVGAEFYEIQVLHLTAGNRASNELFQGDFEDALNFTTSWNDFSMNLPFERGYLCFRVRGVGYKEDGQSLEYGTWSSFTSGEVSDAFNSSDAERIFFCGFDREKNWVSQTSVGINGNLGTEIGYADGLGRGRASIINIEGEEFSSLSETLYDYQGRAVVTMMPFVYENSSGIALPENEMTSFSKINFDRDFTSEQDLLIPSSGGVGASGYYSEDNQLDISHQKYIQNLEGKPYVLSKTLNDGSERVKSQSGVGSVLGATASTQDGKEVVKVYTQPGSQEELDRLFGNEVGYFSNYEKVFTIDQNEQVSVDYIDQYGRIVATALAGIAPSNLESISSGAEMIVSDISELNFLDNQTFSKATYYFTPSSPNTTYTFNYSLADFDFLYNQCAYPDAIDAEYKLSVNIYGEGDSEPIQIISIDPSISETFNVSFTFIAENLEQYRLEKSLKLISSEEESLTHSLEEFSNDYRDFLENSELSCVQYNPLTLEDCSCPFLCIDNWIHNIVGPNGIEFNVVTSQNVETGEIYSVGILEDTNLNGEKDIDDLIIFDDGSTPITLGTFPPFLDCVANCQGEVTDVAPYMIDPCELKYEAMIASLMPGGTFFDNSPDIYIIVDNELVEKNNYNSNEWFEGLSSSPDAWFQNWQGDCLIPYTNFPTVSLTSSFEQIVNDILGTNFDFIDWDDFKNALLSESQYRIIAEEVLLPLHPEYFQYYYNCHILDRCHADPYSEEGDFLAFELEMQNSILEASFEVNPDDEIDDALFAPHLSSNNGYHSNNSGDLSKYMNPELISALGISIDAADPFFSCVSAPVSQNVVTDHFGITHTYTYGQGKDFVQERLEQFMYIGPTNMDCNTVQSSDFISIWYFLEDPEAYGSQLVPDGGNTMPDDIEQAFIEFHTHVSANELSKKQFFWGVYQFWRNFMIYATFHDEMNGIPQIEGSTALFNVFDYDYCVNPPSLGRAESYLTNGELIDLYFANTVPASILSTDFTPDNLLPLFPSNPLFDVYMTNYTDLCNINPDLELYFESATQDICSDLSPLWTNAVNTQCPDASALIPLLETMLIDACVDSDGASNTGEVQFDYNWNGIVYQAWSNEEMINDVLSLEGFNCYVEVFGFGTSGTEFQDAYNVECSCSQLSDQLDALEDVDSNGLANEFLDYVLNVLEVDPIDYSLADAQNAIDAIDAGTCELVDVPAPMICGDLPNPIEDYSPCQEYIDDYNTNLLAFTEELIDQKVAEFEIWYLTNFQENILEHETLSVDYQINEYYYTLYYYDQAGNLIKTVSPEGVSLISAAELEDVQIKRIANVENDIIHPTHSLSSNYTYNSYQEATFEVSADGGESIALYDELGRVLLTQDARQLATGEQNSTFIYSYLIYDDLGRVAESGVVHSTSEMTQELINTTSYEDHIIWLTSGDKEEVSKMYYSEGISSDASSVLEYGQRNLRGQLAAVTHAHDYNDGQPNLYETAYHYSYDPYSNLEGEVQEFADLSLSSLPFITTEYEYDPLTGALLLTDHQRNASDRFITKYHYDNFDQLDKVSTSADGILWNLEVEYFFDPLGNLVRKELGNNKVQGVDYITSAQGLVAINSGTLREDRDFSNDGLQMNQNENKHVASDVFASNLKYFENDFKSILPNNESYLIESTDNEFISLFNGNIAALTTALANNPVDNTINFTHFNRYSYDQLNRIVDYEVYRNEINQQDQVLLDNDVSGLTLSTVFKSSYDYDLNGNITSLSRNDQDGVVIDNMIYGYRPNTNQLVNIEDVASSPQELWDFKGHEANWTYNESDYQSSSENYHYDAIGQLEQDLGECISEMIWTSSGKIKEIKRKPDCDFGGELGNRAPDLEFIYDPNGVRVAKIVKPRNNGSNNLLAETQWDVTLYSVGASGSTQATYKRILETNFESDPLAPGYSYGFKSETIRLDNQLYGAERLGVSVKNTPVAINYVNLSGFDSSTGEAQYLGAPSPVYTYASVESLGSSRGSTMYELTNHLGNVMSVISDRKKLTESFNVEFTFDNDLEGWQTTIYDPNVNMSYQNQALHLTVYTLSGEGITRNITVSEIGLPHTLEFEILSMNSLWDGQAEVLQNGNQLASLIFNETGVHSLSFIPLTDDVVTIKFLDIEGGAFDIELDNIKVFSKSFESEILSLSDYYPFGMKMLGRQFSQGKYRYGFNGMEEDDEFSGESNSNTTYYRQYDTRIGRWTSVDPYASVEAGWSPYRFGFNSPINFTDNSGGYEDHWRFDRTTGDKTKVSDEGGDKLQIYDIGHTDALGDYYYDYTWFKEGADNFHIIRSSDKWIFSKNNYWEGIPSDYNSNRPNRYAYSYSAADLKQRWEWEQESKKIKEQGGGAWPWNRNVFLQDIKNREQQGLAEPIFADEAIELYGHKQYHLMAGLTFADMSVGYVGGSFSTAPASRTPKKLTISPRSPQPEVSGSYHLEFSSGKFYSGKGMKSRMQASIKRIETTYNTTLISKKYYPARSERAAFINEFHLMMSRGGPKSHNIMSPTYNKIHSPGRKYYLGL